MNSGRLEVQWSPCNPDKFITWGSDIYLYETLPKQDIKEGTQCRFCLYSYIYLRKN